jgi:hypothetical protein
LLKKQAYEGEPIVDDEPSEFAVDKRTLRLIEVDAEMRMRDASANVLELLLMVAADLKEEADKIEARGNLQIAPIIIEPKQD